MVQERDTVFIGKLILIGRIEAIARSIVALYATGNMVSRIPHWHRAYVAALEANKNVGALHDTKIGPYFKYLNDHPNEFKKAYENAIVTFVSDSNMRASALQIAGFDG